MPRKSLRRRRSSKSSTKRRKSKKMRGGVTVRAQDLTRLPSDVFGEIREMHPLLTPKNSTSRQHNGPLGIRNEERRNEERHQTNLSTITTKTPKNNR